VGRGTAAAANTWKNGGSGGGDGSWDAGGGEYMYVVEEGVIGGRITGTDAMGSGLGRYGEEMAGGPFWCTLPCDGDCLGWLAGVCILNRMVEEE